MVSDTTYCLLMLLVCRATILVTAEKKCSQVGIHSKECLLKLFNSRIDTSVKPCDDFYQYSCGTFIKNTKLEKSSSENLFKEIEREIEASMIADLGEKVAKSDQTPWGKARRMFQSCMAPNRPMETTKKFEEQIKSIGGFPLEAESFKNKDSLKTFTDFMIKFRNAGIQYDYTIKGQMKKDIREPTKYLLQISQGSLGLLANHMYGVKNATKAYLNFAVTLAKKLGAGKNVAEKEMKLVVDFETKISKFFFSSTEVNKADKYYNKMSIDDLGQKVTGIDWSVLLNAIVGKKLDTSLKVLNVVNLKYLKEAVEVISKTKPRVIANYFIMRHGLKMVEFMDGEYATMFQVFIKAWVNATVSEDPSPLCMSQAGGCLIGAMSRHFVKNYYSPEIKKTITGIVDDMKKVYIDRLKSSTWMSKGTIAKAVEKAKAISTNIGSSDELTKPGVVECHCAKTTITENFFDNVHSIAKAKTLNEFSVYGKPVKKNDFTRSTAFSYKVNKLYAQESNSITLWAGLTQGLIYSPNRPMALNYGSIWSVVGHEMAHAFDMQGRGYDKDGLATDWWSSESNRSYVEKSKCLIDLISSYKYPGLNKTANGRQTFVEGAADVMAIEVGYLALEKYLEKNGEKMHKDYHNLSDRQLFWMGWSQIICEKANKRKRESDLKNALTSPFPLRSTLVLKNSKHFARDYKCKVGAKMYTNQKDKCQF